MEPYSTHKPYESGRVVDVTGSLIVDTGLRKVRTFSATLAAEPIATDCIVAAALLDEPDRATKRLTLYVKAADGTTDGVTATAVAWHALGE
jgi:hypothetical protein